MSTCDGITKALLVVLTGCAVWDFRVGFNCPIAAISCLALLDKLILRQLVGDIWAEIFVCLSVVKASKRRKKVSSSGCCARTGVERFDKISGGDYPTEDEQGAKNHKTA